MLELPVSTSVANWQRAFDSEAFDGEAQGLFVAEAVPGGIVAFVLVGGYTSGVFSDAAIAAVYPREIVSLHVAPEWQHRGVGRSLVRTVSDWLITRKAKTVAVRALRVVAAGMITI